MDSSKLFNPKIINIYGNIGVGKSTFINELFKELMKYHENICKVDEPINIWKSVIDHTTGKNILQTFYDDIKRWGYTFESLTYITRVKVLLRAISEANKIILTDQSPETGINIFSKMLFDDGLISELEYECQKEWRDFYQTELYEKYQRKIIYLHCTPKTAFHRIHDIRHREEEKNVSIDYVRRVHEYHEEWLLDMDKENILDKLSKGEKAITFKNKNGIDILVLDYDKDFDIDSITSQQYMQYVLEFIKQD